MEFGLRSVEVSLRPHFMVKKASWFVCFLVLAISCLDEPDCFRLNNNLVGVSFKKMLGGQADTVALVGVQASGTDSIFNQFIITSGVYLPLNYFNTQTAFALQGIEELNHLVFGYEVKSQFVSEECGARYVLSNLSLINHDFDSVKFTNSTPSASEGGSNIEIYRCPRTNILKLAFRQLQGEASVASPLKIVSVIDDLSVTRYIDTTLQIIYLPVNPSAESSQFNVTFLDRINTLTVNYKKYPRKFFEVCGDQLLFGSLTVPNNNFDSLLIVRDSIQDPPITNITVYRCPETNLARIYFRKNGSPIRSDTLSVLKVTDDYSGNTLYEDEDLILATLPLNTESDTTQFIFELEDGSTKRLTLKYTRTPTVQFNACGPQTLFSALEVVTSESDFSLTQVTRPAVVFPIQTNIEIINTP